MGDGQLQCHFCGRNSEEAGQLIQGREKPVLICGRCLAECQHKLDVEIGKTPPAQPVRRRITTAKDVIRHLDTVVIGQHNAKRKLGIAVMNHSLRLLDNEARRLRGEGRAIDDLGVDPKLADIAIEKSNILLIGPSGSGKTLLAKSLAETLGVPFAMADATSLTEAGYVGEDVESILQRLLQAAALDLLAAERGVVFIDEIDKIARRPMNGRDVGGQAVQQALLKIIEGGVVNVPPHGDKKHSEQCGIPVDTTDILFIFGGAFVGLEEMIGRRRGRGRVSFGFGQSSSANEDEGFLKHVRPGDLEEFGMIPEFVGRLPVIAILEPLGENDLARILTEPRDGLNKQYRKLFHLLWHEMEFMTPAIGETARIALERGTGARGLRAVVEETLEDALLAASEEQKRKFFIVVAETVRGEQTALAVDWPSPRKAQS